MNRPENTQCEMGRSQESEKSAGTVRKNNRRQSPGYYMARGMIID